MKTCVPVGPEVALRPRVLSVGGVGVIRFGAILVAAEKLLAATSLNPKMAPAPPMTTITSIEQAILKTKLLRPPNQLFM